MLVPVESLILFAAIPANVDREPLPRLKVAEGQTITLTCESSGKPKPSVVWFKGNQPLTGDRHVVQDNGDLLIKVGAETG